MSIPEVLPTAPYLGPFIVGALGEAVEQGIIINQFCTFWSQASGESLLLRITVLFVSGMALFQTSAVFYSLWHAQVLHFGDFAAAAKFSWVDSISTFVTMAMATPVQAFFIWRCWTLMGKNRLVLGLLSFFLFITTVGSIIATVQSFAIDFTKIVVGQEWLVLTFGFIISLVSSAALDVLVTGILLVYLWRAKSSIHSGRFRRTFRKLLLLIWEAALPPCVCAIMTIITYFALIPKSSWNLAFQAILGKLYVISLFVTLNGRKELANAGNAKFTYNWPTNLQVGTITPSSTTSNTASKAVGGEQNHAPDTIRDSKQHERVAINTTIPGPVPSGDDKV